MQPARHSDGRQSIGRPRCALAGRGSVDLERWDEAGVLLKLNLAYQRVRFGIRLSTLSQMPAGPPSAPRERCGSNVGQSSSRLHRAHLMPP